MATARDDETPGRGSPSPHVALGPRAAAVLVFASSAAVLVLEITALRLLAPYLGLTLQTSTLIIGLALTAIAVGSWWGGNVADQQDPRRLLGPALMISGAVVAVTPAVVRTAAEWTPTLLIVVATATILIPGALLAAVTPMVTKIALTTLAETGSVVGRLSGIGTAGAIVGTVLTGFVLLSRLPVSAILVGLGVLLVAGGAVTSWRMSAAACRPVLAALLATVAGGVAAVVAPGGCDAETQYHCVRILADADRAGGATLVLDGVRHSYVDDDPTYLQFGYIRAFAAVVDAAFAPSEPLSAYHLGGGGLTFPRLLAATRPGTTGVVSEIDGGVVRIDREVLGTADVAGLDVRVEDGRLGLRRLAPASVDLVAGDAFGGVSVPWHLTTVEALADVRRALTDDGIYVANLIDHGELAFVRAEVATLVAVFDHVVLLGKPGDLDSGAPGGSGGGNLVVVAADRPLDVAAIRDGLAARDTGWTTSDGAVLATLVGDARVLTDDRAPVDQLLEPVGSPGGRGASR